MADYLSTGNDAPSRGDGDFAQAHPRAWARLDRWMDWQLNKLVKKWSHVAAPNAGRPEVGIRRGALLRRKRA